MNTKSSLLGMIGAAAAAYGVMLFINSMIGSMGGVPAFAAFLLVFWPLRRAAFDQKTHPKTGSLLRRYAIGYLLFWGVFRIAFQLLRMMGWGSAVKKTLPEYAAELLAAPLLEKWAYGMAAVVMFAFVLSLFPLVVIKEIRRILWYVLADAAGFTLFVLALGKVLQELYETGNRRVQRLIDHLLLCGSLAPLQELLGLLAALVLAAAVGVFVFFYAKRERAGRAEQKPAVSGKRRTAKTVLLVGFFAAAAVTAAVVGGSREETGQSYEKAAVFLTKDDKLGPLAYGDAVYIPVSENAPADAGSALGYLAKKGENCSSRFYQLAAANILYRDSGGQTDLLWADGTDPGVYASAARLLQERAWEGDSVFLLWDEDWSSESVYSHEPTGYTACSADLIEGIYMQFSDTSYTAADFSDYDAYFTVRAYGSMEQALDDPVSGDWAGCILVKDDKFYFAGGQNRITGICMQQLREVLGGN